MSPRSREPLGADNVTTDPSENRVLILDANQRSALAATRSLGKRGLIVVTADEMPRTLSGASRYCHEATVYPSPYEHPLAFIDALRREVIDRRINVIFPMSDVTTKLLLDHSDVFGDVKIPCPSAEAFDAVSDKWELYLRARELGIPVPHTALVRSRTELATIVRGMAFPLVVKPRRSRMMSGGVRWIAPPVRYAHSPDELERSVVDESFEGGPFLVQECVAGRGQGLFGLYAEGKVVTFFAHRRLREKPPSGGVSVLSESVPVDPRLREISQRLLDSVDWHGVAMVEFNVSPDGTPYLIEINGRFWGSLQLAIEAGVDFPWLLYRVAIGEPVAPVDDYAVGMRNLWLLGDLDHLYLRLRGRGGLAQKFRAVCAFIRMFESDTRHEVDRWNDPRPFLRELASYLRGPRR
jgi:predicted ATP-grasp superfamily ATP-dependent carboligase